MPKTSHLTILTAAIVPKIIHKLNLLHLARFGFSFSSLDGSKATSLSRNLSFLVVAADELMRSEDGNGMSLDSMGRLEFILVVAIGYDTVSGTDKRKGTGSRIKFCRA